jgi:hypothetical protein
VSALLSFMRVQENSSMATTQQFIVGLRNKLQQIDNT